VHNIYCCNYSPLDVQKFRLYVHRKEKYSCKSTYNLKICTKHPRNCHEQIYVQPEILHSSVPADEKVVKSVRHQIQTPDKQVLFRYYCQSQIDDAAI
jgi:hypothetical protein